MTCPVLANRVDPDQFYMTIEDSDQQTDFENYFQTVSA